jgi:translation initiation factor IF-2
MRVFELAKKIGVTSKELMAILAKSGVEVKNHMSTLDDADVRVISERFAKSKAKGSKASAGADPAPPAPERKGRVLIKKAKPLQEPAKPEETALSEPAALSVSSPLEPSLKTEPVEESPIKGAPSLPGTTPVEASPPALGAQPAAPKPETEAERKEREKKKGKPDGRKELPGKGKGFKKEKTRRPGRWDIGEEIAEPALEAAAPEGGAEGTPEGAEAAPAAPAAIEARKWKDFKPIHKKEDRMRNAARRAHPTALSEITKPRQKAIKLHLGVTVKEFAELTGQKPSTIIGRLMEMGNMAAINQPIDLNAATLIAESFGLKCEISAERTEEELLEQPVETRPENLEPRPPVITIMGHVDHGKTSLLDAIRQTRVTEGEAGGITQHIGAYVVNVGKKRVTFLDTPGHEAFTAMRARGAKVTDIVVLVVAADDGVMPQTVEAINHAKAAGVPMIVAINKVDKPEANPDRVKHSLAEYELIPEEWGGKTIFVEVSAKKKTGLEHLLEMILLQSEVLELKADPRRPVRGTIIEAKIDKGRGPVATVLVQEGTLRVGDVFVSGMQFGKVRALIDDTLQKVSEAGPALPVEVIGLDGVPQAGDSFLVVADERAAKEVASARTQRQRTLELSKMKRVTLDELYSQISEGTVQGLNVLIKADVQGSAEALKDALEKLPSGVVKLRVIHSGVGGIAETDVLLASASNAIIVGFNVRPEPKAQALAEREKVDIRLYTIIYDAVADIKAAMEGLLEPTLKERSLGRVEVRQVFSIPKVGSIAGGYVTEGMISRSSAGARVLRDNVVIYEGKLSSLRRFKDDAREVQAGYECGVGIENFNDIKVGDVIEVYTFDKIATKLT